MVKKMCTSIIFLLVLTNLAISQWEMLNGPGDNRYIYSMDIDSNQILINIFTELYYSNDFGANWQHINKEADFSFDYAYPILIKGKDIFLSSAWGVDKVDFGLYSTSDLGKTWEHSDFYFTKIFRINSKIYTLKNHNIYSFDEEQNIWNPVFDTIPRFSTILSYYEDSTYCILGSWVNKESISQDNKSFNIDVYNKNTKEWTSVCDTLSNIWYKHILCITKKDSLILAGTSNGIYSSKNNGLNWELYLKQIKFGDSLYPFSYSVHKLYVKENNLYAICSMDTISYSSQFSLNTFICYSSNNGKEWLIDTLYNYDSPREIGFIGDTLIIATESGLFSSDISLTNKVSLINQTLRGELTLDFDCDNNTIYTATPYNNPGISYSTDYGSSWEKLENDLINYGISKIAVKDNHFFVGVNFNSFFMSSDTGKTFTRITTDNGLYDNTVLKIKIIDSLVYLGTLSGLYVSEDWGNNWTNITSKYDLRVYSIEKNNNQIIIGSNNNVLMISEDNGKSWIKKLIPDEYLNYIWAINIKNDRIIIGTTHSPKEKEQFNGRGLYISKDNGNTFEKYNVNLSDFLGVSTILSYDNHDFLASNHKYGMFYSTNQGESWISYSKGLTNRYLYKIEILGKYLIAATSGGMFRVPLSDFGIVGVDEIEVKPDYLWASTPYPNPAKGFVQSKIYWDMNNDIKNAKFEVYDIYGNKIADNDKITVFSENDYSGIIKWECGEVENGIYLITIHHGTKVQILKVCVVK